MQSEIYLAGGCFWGVEKYFSLLPGVIKTSVGYANGHIENPTYKMVCDTDTGHAETIHVVYDSGQTSLEDLLEEYYKIIDPTALNRQGPDIGTQYRTGIYYTDPGDCETIARSLDILQKRHEEPVVVENLPLEVYYLAEEYHQKYLDKNPNGYCHISPSAFKTTAK